MSQSQALARPRPSIRFDLSPQCNLLSPSLPPTPSLPSLPPPLSFSCSDYCWSCKIRAENEETYLSCLPFPGGAKLRRVSRLFTRTVNVFTGHCKDFHRCPRPPLLPPPPSGSSVLALPRSGHFPSSNTLVHDRMAANRISVPSAAAAAAVANDAMLTVTTHAAAAALAGWDQLAPVGGGCT